MKSLINKGLLFIGMTYAFQANAAIIQITEDRLTIDTSVWFFEERSPTYPPSDNTLLKTESNRYQGAMLGLNKSMRRETTAVDDDGDYGRWGFVDAAGTPTNIMDIEHRFGTYLNPNAINDGSEYGSYGYAAAGWESTSRFTVNGDGASLTITSFSGTPRNHPSTSSSYRYLGFELIDETAMQTIIVLDDAMICPSTPTQICPSNAEKTFALQDGRSYSLTTTGYIRSPFVTYNISEPDLHIQFDNARRVTVPEPSTALLLLLGTLGMGLTIRSQRRPTKV